MLNRAKINRIIHEGISHIKNGLGHTAFGNILSQGIMFIGAIIVIRIIPKADFGVLAYALSIYSILYLFRGMGMYSSAMKFCSKSVDDVEATSRLRFAFITGFTFNILLAAGFITASFFIESAPLVRAIVPLICFAYIYDILITFLRAKMKFKKYSQVLITYSIILAVSLVSLSYLCGINGYIIGQYIAMISAGILAFIMVRPYLKKGGGIPNKDIAMQMLKFGISIMLVNSVSQLAYLLDTVMVGFITAEGTLVADYKIATQIPNAIRFLPVMVIMYIQPFFFKHSDDIKWIKAKTIKVIASMSAIFIPLSIVLILIAPWLMRILYGTQYEMATLSFQILCAGFALTASFRMVIGNVLVVLNKLKVNFINALICSILNIVLNIYLINAFSSVGAAIATFTTMLVNVLIGGIYLLIYFKRKGAVSNE